MAAIKRFYSNEDDNLHCLQSCYRMIFYTIFEKEISLLETDIDTNFEKDIPTWPFKAMNSLVKYGLEVKHYERFDPYLFLTDPNKAIENLFDNRAIADEVLGFTDIPNEQELVRQCLNSGKVEFIVKTPTIDDIIVLLQEKYFVICNVNSPSLIGLDEYAGHFVIVEEITSDGKVKLQNPGLPAIENQVVELSLFLKAFHFPNAENGNVVAIRK